MNEKAEDLAFGRWPDILQARGMSSNYFGGRNGPCPFCPDGGGKDRFRWSNKYGGVWVCNVCTEGKYSNGFTMLMRHMGYFSFREAADDVRSFFGAGSTVQPISREARAAYASGSTLSEEEICRNRARMQRIWDEADELRAGDPVTAYLQRRVGDLNFQPSHIRCHPALPYWLPPATPGDRFQMIGRYPAMLAYAQDVNGALAQLHKTYLTPEGLKADVPVVKKTDLGIGTNSFAIRMVEPYGNTLGVSEGIETGIAGALLRGIPVWPCLNGSAMAEFELPKELRAKVTTVVIFEDTDGLKAFGRNADGSVKMRRPGSVYAQKLATRLRSIGLKSLIIKSAKVGEDIADYWSAKVAA